MATVDPTPEVQRAVSIAYSLAERWRHKSLTIAHLLLGLIQAEDEVGRHVLRGLRLEPDAIERLLESLTPDTQKHFEEVYGESLLREIWETGAGEARRRSHAYIALEHLVLGMAVSDIGGMFLQQLHLSPQQIQQAMDSSLQTIPHSISEDPLTMLRELQTPDFLPDYKKIVARSPFSLYVLKNSNLGFRLCRGDRAISNGVIEHVSFGFARPFCVAAPGKLRHIQLLQVQNYGNSSEWINMPASTWLNFEPTMITKGTLQPPPEFIGLLDIPGNQMNLARWQELFNSADWRLYDGSGLHFKIAFWDGAQVPVGWAYSTEQEPLVVIATLGVPRLDFLEVLNSLVILELSDENLLAALQNELRVAKHEFRQYKT